MGSKTVHSRLGLGSSKLRVPHVRSGNFFPSSLEKGLRSERALRVSMAEMHLNGVATRKVSKVMEATCGFEVSSQEVSRAAAALVEQIAQWRPRPLSRIRYLLLDAIYCNLRDSGVVRDCACHIAIGIKPEGTRERLGTALELGESEILWRSFMESLLARGVTGIELIVSDDHTGLKATRKAVFPSVPWQRCQFHLQQNVQAYVPRVSMRREVAADIREVFNASSLEEAERLLGIAARKYEKSAPKLAAWLDANIREGLTVFDVPENHRRKLRTSSMIERLNLGSV